MIRGRTCPDGGLLVSATTRLASDPCEYCHPAVTSVGCNRLRCSRCGEWVRNEAGFALKNVPRDIAALYASQDWPTLPFVCRRRSSRLYTCRCTTWEAEIDYEIDNDHDATTAPNVPWACQGHPAPELPCTLGELTIAADADW